MKEPRAGRAPAGRGLVPTPVPVFTALLACPALPQQRRGRAGRGGPGHGHAPCSPRRSGRRSAWPGRTSSSGKRTSRSRTLGGRKGRGGVSRGAARPLRGALRGRAGQGGGGGGRRAVYFTLHKVRVVGLVGREHRRHLVVVGGVDVLVNAIAGQLYL